LYTNSKMAFNFDKFESEFKQKRLFQSVAQLFGEIFSLS
jgi:hypothetical protein